MSSKYGQLSYGYLTVDHNWCREICYLCSTMGVTSGTGIVSFLCSVL